MLHKRRRRRRARLAVMTKRCVPEQRSRSQLMTHLQDGDGWEDDQDAAAIKKAYSFGDDDDDDIFADDDEDNEDLKSDPVFSMDTVAVISESIKSLLQSQAGTASALEGLLTPRELHTLHSL